MSDSNGGGGFGWFLAGLGIGAAIGMLYAPKAGKETREDLLRRAEEGKDYVKNRAQEARQQATQWVDRDKEMIDQQKEQSRSAYEAGRQAFKDATTQESPKST
jgi:gas vesicle protein